MPTVYTELLKNKKYNIKKWLKEDCVRQFGVCVCLRDMNNISEEEIISKLTELANCYKRQKPEPLEEEHLNMEYHKHIDYYSNKLTEEIKNYSDYQKNIDLINQLSKFTATELTINVIKFAYDQLNLIKDEFDSNIKYAQEQLNLSFDEFKLKKQKDYEYNLKIYEEMKKQQTNLNKNRLNSYINFVNEIDNLFKKLESEETNELN